jgi:hypothetical protein
MLHTSPSCWGRVPNYCPIKLPMGDQILQNAVDLHKPWQYQFAFILIVGHLNLSQYMIIIE